MKNTYKLISNDEPTEKQLAELMHEVAVEAKQRAVVANKKLLDDIKQATAAALRKQSEEIIKHERIETETDRHLSA